MNKAFILFIAFLLLMPVVSADTNFNPFGFIGDFFEAVHNFIWPETSFKSQNMQDTSVSKKPMEMNAVNEKEPELFEEEFFPKMTKEIHLFVSEENPVHELIFSIPGSPVLELSEITGNEKEIIFLEELIKPLNGDNVIKFKADISNLNNELLEDEYFVEINFNFGPFIDEKKFLKYGFSNPQKIKLIVHNDFCLQEINLSEDFEKLTEQEKNDSMLFCRLHKLNELNKEFAETVEKISVNKNDFIEKNSNIGSFFSSDNADFLLYYYLSIHSYTPKNSLTKFNSDCNRFSFDKYTQFDYDDIRIPALNEAKNLNEYYFNFCNANKLYSQLIDEKEKTVVLLNESNISESVIFECINEIESIYDSRLKQVLEYESVLLKLINANKEANVDELKIYDNRDTSITIQHEESYKYGLLRASDYLNSIDEYGISTIESLKLQSDLIQEVNKFHALVSKFDFYKENLSFKQKMNGFFYLKFQYLNARKDFTQNRNSWSKISEFIEREYSLNEFLLKDSFDSEQDLINFLNANKKMHLNHILLEVSAKELLFEKNALLSLLTDLKKEKGDKIEAIDDWWNVYRPYAYTKWIIYNDKFNEELFSLDEKIQLIQKEIDALDFYLNK
ncbi:MAG: hypothetical protein JW703_02025, partial [Candidatus Diapherotrites archaeon]|nr:hypothetical protein [Candidatus Diapherotrites archaeon]